MAIQFAVAFAERHFTIDGTTAAHLDITAAEPASEKFLYHFTLNISTAGNGYTHTLEADMPSGQSSLRVPFVPPLEWANDCTEELGDAQNEVCGSLFASLAVDYTAYVGREVVRQRFYGFQDRIDVAVPPQLVPTVGPITVAAVDGLVPAAWGLWVQKISVARIEAAQAAGCYGSTIRSYIIGGREGTECFREVRLTEAGTVTIPVTVVDSRGRRATQDVLFAVQPYAAPVLRGISSVRCDGQGNQSEAGTDFLAKAEPEAAALPGGVNPCTVTAQWRRVTDAAWGVPHTLDAARLAEGVRVPAGLDGNASYEVKYTVRDAFFGAEYLDYISSTAYLLHFRKGGTGIAVGKAAEQDNLFDVALPAALRRDLSVGGDLNIAGALRLNGTDVGDALQGLGTVQTAQLVPDDTLLDVEENSLVKIGRVVCGRLRGSLSVMMGPYEGEAYQIARLPEGYYSPVYPALAVAAQNGVPCKGVVNPEGRVFVIPTADWQTDTEITIFALL